jgi:diacylglycerol kinase (ATP)
MSKDERVKKPKSSLDSLNFAIDGVIHAFKTEKHIRYHYIIAIGALFLSLVFRLPAFEFALLALSIVMLLFAEMVNTAIEEVVNLVEDKYNIIARNAKDVSAGAVLISGAGVVIIAYMIFSKYFYAPMAEAMGETEHSGHVAFVSLILVLICVVIMKARFGKGRPLHGGLPSGHAAVAFSLWVSVAVISQSPLVMIITFVMAGLVSHSRLIKGIHTWLEVIVGALMGAGITAAVFYAFYVALGSPRP